jgi:hypothetical protein
MPHLNGTGPLGKGQKTGRGIGNCSESKIDFLSKLGKGLGLKKKNGCDKGLGKRLKYIDK